MSIKDHNNKSWKNLRSELKNALSDWSQESIAKEGEAGASRRRVSCMDSGGDPILSALAEKKRKSLFKKIKKELAELS